MKLVVKTVDYSWCLEFYGKYNFVIGDSGTHKTHLYRELRNDEMRENSKECIIECEIPVYTYEEYLGLDSASRNTLKLVVLDEEVQSRKVRRTFWNSVVTDNTLFVLSFGRDLPGNIPYGCNNVFSMCSVGENSYCLKNVLNISDRCNTFNSIDTIVCEDSKSGYYAVSKCYNDLNVISSHGRSNIVVTVQSLSNGNHIAIFCDLCGLGIDILSIINLLKIRDDVALLPVLSFEFLLLHHKLFSGTSFVEYRLLPLSDMSGVNEEVYYTKVLSKLFVNVLGVKYSKSDLDIIDSLLLCDSEWMPTINSNVTLCCDTSKLKLLRLE